MRRKIYKFPNSCIFFVVIYDAIFFCMDGFGFHAPNIFIYTGSRNMYRECLHKAAGGEEIENFHRGVGKLYVMQLIFYH